MLAEDVIVLRFYTYIRYVIFELRNLLFFIVIAFSLLFVAQHVYAFRADQAIDAGFLMLFVLLAVTLGRVLAGMERDPLLSRLQDSSPGQLGRGFYWDLVKYGTVPLLRVIGSQVPAVSNLLLRWVQPTLEAMR